MTYNPNITGPCGSNANLYIIARDPERRKVLLGGLGSLGVGTKWFDEDSDSDRYCDYPGYATAPIRSSEELRVE